MIFKILFIIFAVVFVALCISMFEDIRKSNRKKISFKEALDLVELPVVTFVSQGKKLNFLLDTGANNSIINGSALDGMNVDIKSFDGVETNTAGGDVTLNRVVTLNIEYCDRNYTECFLIHDMDDAFTAIKKETGVLIHGILGSNFFATYKYIIDYDSLAVFVK